MKQLSFIPNHRSRREHGGSLLLGKRRVRRPLSHKTPLHLVLRSDFAYGHRALVRHRPLIDRVLAKAAKRFQVRVYEKGVVSNHIHLAVRSQSRLGLQNFFRVVAGHIAQEILKQFPLLPGELLRAGGAQGAPGAPGASTAGGKARARGAKAEDRRGRTAKKAPPRERENKFWQTRIYSRIVSWGREYLVVKAYVLKNHLEGLGVIAYVERVRRAIQPQSRNNTS